MASKENRVWTIVFVVFVIACAAVVAARFGFLNGFVTIPNQVTTTNGSDDAADAYLAVDDSSELVDSLGPRKWKIIDVHEHLLGEAEAIKLLAEMDKFHIQRTCLMASSKYTLTLNPIYGFEALDENNQAILAVKKIL